MVPRFCYYGLIVSVLGMCTCQSLCPTSLSCTVFHLLVGVIEATFVCLQSRQPCLCVNWHPHYIKCMCHCELNPLVELCNRCTSRHNDTRESNEPCYWTLIPNNRVQGLVGVLSSHTATPVQQLRVTESYIHFVDMLRHLLRQRSVDVLAVGPRLFSIR